MKYIKRMNLKNISLLDMGKIYNDDKFREIYHPYSQVHYPGILEPFEGYLMRKFPFMTDYCSFGALHQYDNYLYNRFGNFRFKPNFFWHLELTGDDWQNLSMQYNIVLDDEVTINDVIDTFMVQVDSLLLTNKDRYSKLFETTVQSYDMLQGGKSIEEWNGSYTETRTPDLSNETSKDAVKNKTDIENKISAMDSVVYQPNTEQIIDEDIGAVKVTSVSRGTEKLVHDEGDRKKIITGNTNFTPAEIIEQERKLAMFSFYETIFEDIAKNILVYSEGV